MISIDELIKNAMKSGNKTELQAYRNLKAEFQKVKTAKDYKGEWTDELELHTIAKYGRTLDTDIASCGGSQTILGREYSDELEVIKRLLPEPVKASQVIFELSKWVGKTEIRPTGVSTKDGQKFELYMEIPRKDMGNAIKYLKSKFPTADGKIISDVVKKYVI